MNKKMGKPKGPKSSNQIAKTRRKLSKSDISDSVIPDYASVDSEVVSIKVRPRAKTNNRISESEMLSDRATPTASVTKDYPRSKLASNRKSPVQGKLKKVNALTAPNDFTVLKKKSPQIKSKPKQTQKEVERTVSLDDQIKTLRNRQDDLRQKLASLGQQSKSFIFIKSKEHRAKERELNSQLNGITRAKWRTELDRKFENDKRLGILDFVSRSRSISKPNNKYLEGIDKIVREHSQQYGHYVCNNRDDFLNSRSFVYKSLQEIMDRANPTYEDKQILLRYDAYQVKALLQSSDIKGKEDKKALEEIYKDLKNEMSKSRKSFDSKNDQYIHKLRENRSTLPDPMLEVSVASSTTISKS